MNFGSIEMRTGTDNDGKSSWFRIGWHRGKVDGDITLPSIPRRGMDEFAGHRQFRSVYEMNEREIMQVLTDNPKMGRKVIFSAITNGTSVWGIAYSVCLALLALSLILPVILAMVIFIVTGFSDPTPWMNLASMLPPILRAMGFFGAGVFVMKKLAMRYASPTMSNLQSALDTELNKINVRAMKL